MPKVTFDYQSNDALKLEDLAIGEYGVLTELPIGWTPNLLGQPFIAAKDEIVFLTVRVWAHRNNCTARCRRLREGEVITITGDGK